MGFRQNFRRSWSTTKIYRMGTTFFSFDPVYIRVFLSNSPRKVVDLTTLNILKTMLMSFCITDTPRGQIRICGCKVFRLFQQIFACGKVNGNTTKRQKTSAFKNFLLPRYSKNELHSEIKSPPLPNTPPRSTSDSYSGVIRVKMFVLKHWVFLDDIWDFNKCKSLIIDEKCWMLWTAMLRIR